MTINKGDTVWLEADGKRMLAEITLVSPSRVSLLVRFDGFFCGYIGGMALVWEQDRGTYVDVFREEVEVCLTASS